MTSMKNEKLEELYLTNASSLEPGMLFFLRKEAWILVISVDRVLCQFSYMVAESNRPMHLVQGYKYHIGSNWFEIGHRWKLPSAL